MTPPAIPASRRAVLRGMGALIVSFSLARRAAAQTETGTAEGDTGVLPGDLHLAPFLDAWIRIGADGNATIFTGKGELGQGIMTALLQLAAEELKLPMARLKLVTADTSLTANEGYTAASHSVQDSGTAIRNAAAQVREILIDQAAARLRLDPALLHATDGVVHGPNGAALSYGALVQDELLHVQAQPRSKLTDPRDFTIMDRPVPRVDIPAKLTGGAAYVQDMRLPGMLHGRIIRPPSYGAQLLEVDTSVAAAMPGVVKIIRNGSFLGVVAQREFQAIKAMRVLAEAARWQETAQLPDELHLPEALRALASQDTTILDRQATVPALPVASVTAQYSRPYIAHGSIGPSCAVAWAQGDQLTIWTHTQGVFMLRGAIAEMLGRPPESVRCIHAQGAGCYGHNGADDVAADAALLAMALPGSPIRVQWMREQEHAWEPYGPAMLATVRASLSATGYIADWQYEVWSNSHMMRPGRAGTLLAAREIDPPFPPPVAVMLAQPEGGGDRNGIPLYTLPSGKIISHFLPQMPVRVSSMRSLGAQLNIFAIESTMDELAQHANEDPVNFRLKHLQDERARDVITLAAAKFGWATRPQAANGVGCGFGFAQYKNLEAYCAVAMEVEIDPESGRIAIRRVVAAVDTGQVVNPDGVRNQVEGAILLCASWMRFEAVTFDTTRITSVDWASYPIMRYGDVPGSIDVHIIDRPGYPFLGCGETGQAPAGAALANAVADAAGRRIYDMPLSPARVKTAFGGA